MKKIMLSILTILLVIGLVGAGTLAWFRDTETSTGNTFRAGTMNLQVRDNNEAWPPGIQQSEQDGAVATWTATNMAPGNSWDFDGLVVDLRNAGTIKGDHLEITSDYTVIEESPQTEADTDPYTHDDPDSMAKFMEITRAEYHDGDWKINLLDGTWGFDPVYPAPPPFPPGYVVGDWTIADVDSDERITFFDLKNDVLDDLPPPNGTFHFVMSVRFSPDAGNDFQGDTFNLTMQFTLNQHSSQ